MTASCDYRSDPESARTFAAALSSFLRDPDLAALAIEQEGATHASLEKMVAALTAWGDDPDAFWCETWCEAVGWKA
jgi:hypothetical protein